MEIDIDAWGYGFKLVLGAGNVILLVGSIVVTHMLDRFFLGKKARADLDNLKKSNGVLNARMSILERQREPEPLPPPGPPAAARDAAGGIPAVESDEDVWRRSPGAGRVAARLMMTAPTLLDAERIFDGFRVAPVKEHADWANWALLFRLEEAGRAREVYERAFDLWDEGGFLEDTETQRELQRLYEISRKPEQGRWYGLEGRTE